MIKFLKNVLVSFIITVFIFWGSSDILATRYIVNIAVVGAVRGGKTSLIKRLTGIGDFTQEERNTNWDSNAFSKVMHKEIGDDVFTFNFWDAPGYSQGEKGEVVRQLIDRKALAISSFAVVVININSKDVQRKDSYPDTISEAMSDYVNHIVTGDFKIKVIIVGSHADEVSKEQIDTFKKQISEKLGSFKKVEPHCFIVSSKNAKDPGREELINYLLAQTGDLDKSRLKHFSGAEVDCHKCGKYYAIELCGEPKDGFYYCPEHQREKLKKKCPGSSPDNRHMFVPSDETCVRCPVDGNLYCSEGCMRKHFRKPCDFRKCGNFVEYDDHRFEENGSRCCCREHLLEVQGIPCECGRSPLCEKLFLRKDAKKYMDKLVCSECRQYLDEHPEDEDMPKCCCEGIDEHVIKCKPIVGKDGVKKYCSKFCQREMEGEQCSSCGRRILKNDTDGSEIVPREANELVRSDEKKFEVLEELPDGRLKVKVLGAISDSGSDDKYYCSECAMGCLMCRCDAGNKCCYKEKGSEEGKLRLREDFRAKGNNKRYKNKRFCDEKCRHAWEDSGCVLM